MKYTCDLRVWWQAGLGKTWKAFLHTHSRVEANSQYCSYLYVTTHVMAADGERHLDTFMEKLQVHGMPLSLQ